MGSVGKTRIAKSLVRWPALFVALLPSVAWLASGMAEASFTSQASARQDWSNNLPSRSTRAELARLNFRAFRSLSVRSGVSA